MLRGHIRRRYMHRSRITQSRFREQLLSMAKLLVWELRGGLGLSLLLAQSGQSRGGTQTALLRPGEAPLPGCY